MSPEEAKTKWCPFSAVALTSGVAANRTASMGTGGYADLTDETRCLADGCMFWRWFSLRSPDTREKDDPGDGYCGGATFIQR
jgi:hypothetical protein